jgi:hypothetical protein
MTFFKQGHSKYRATKVLLDGRSFGSKLEASVYALLKLREKAKEIEILQCQDHVYLTDARILYVADFKCKWLKNGEIFHVEAKGFETPEWRIKLRLWKHYGPNSLEIFKGSHLRPQLVETIYPGEKHEVKLD